MTSLGEGEVEGDRDLSHGRELTGTFSEAGQAVPRKVCLASGLGLANFNKMVSVKITC